MTPSAGSVDTTVGDFRRSSSDGSGRHAQMTYSSFDDGSPSGGGWQIKQTEGGLSESESAELRYWVTTTVDTVEPLPQYPSPDEINSFPRRLMYTGLDGDRAGYWHTAPAGADGSGRPGNVFAHVLLDREVAGGVVTDRPVDLWRSPQWLTPYGPTEVTAAVIAGHRPFARGEAVTRASVIDFLCDPTEWRLGLLGVLVDAVAAALDGGPKVILGCDSADVAALWIGCASHLMPASTARRFHFSTFERADDVAITVGRGVHLVAVPTTDLERLTDIADAVLLRADETPSMGDLGGAPHRTASGSAVEVTPWSVITQGVMVDPAVADRVLRTQDEVGAALGSVATKPAWGLAMAVALIPELHDELLDEASSVIARSSPEELRATPHLVGAAAAFLSRSLGTTAEDAWSRLEGVDSSPSGYSVSVEMILAVYVERALADERWLSASGGVAALPALPRAGWVPDALAGVVVDWVDRTVAATDGGHVDDHAALVIVRALDLLSQSGCIGPTAPNVEALRATADADPSDCPVMELCRRIVNSAVVPVLFREGDAAHGFVGDCGAIRPRTSRMLIVPVVTAHPAMHTGSIGRRLDEVVLRWLLTPLPPVPDRGVLTAGLENRSELTLVAELAYQVLAGPKDKARLLGSYAPLVLTRMAEQSANPVVVPADPGPVFAVRVRDVDLVATLLDRYADTNESIIPARFLTGILESEPASRSLRAIALRAEWNKPTTRWVPLAPRGEGDDYGTSLAAMRIRSEWALMRPTERLALQNRHLAIVLRRTAVMGPARLAADLAQTIAVVGTVAAIDDPMVIRQLADLKPFVLSAEKADRAALVDAVADLVGPAGLAVKSVVVAAVIGSPEAPRSSAALPVERFLGSLTQQVDDGVRSLLDSIVHRLIDRDVYDGPYESEEIDGLLVERLQRVGRDNTDKLASQYRKFAKKWLDDRGLGSGGLMSRIRRK